MNNFCQVAAYNKNSLSGRLFNKLSANVKRLNLQNGKQIVFLVNNSLTNKTPYGEIAETSDTGCLLQLFSRLTGQLLETKLFVKWNEIEDYIYENDFPNFNVFEKNVFRFSNLHDREKLSELVSRRLQELKIKKSELAEKIGISRTYVTDIANGTANTPSGEYSPSSDVVSALAKALKITESEILEAMNYLPDNNKANIPASVRDAFAREGRLSENDEVLIANFIEMLKKNNQNQ